MKSKINSIFSFKNCATLAFINFIFALFVDTMLIYKDFKINHIESYFYVILTNVAFVAFLILSAKKRDKNKKHDFNLKKIISEHYAIIFVVCIVVILAVIKYDTVAIYDAHLYYGSFITAFRKFDFTIASAIGSFNLWGHSFIGSALFIAPFESFAVGEMVGSYIANTLMFAISLVMLYSLLNNLIVKSNRVINTIIVVIFAFMPYSFSLITYFCPDFYVPIYLIWLMYAFKKKNNLMVSFLGFVMCLTTDTAAFTYGFFVLTMFICDWIKTHYKKSSNWFNLREIPYGSFVIWLLPAVIYFIVFMIKDKFLLQEFVGSEPISFGIQKSGIIMQHFQSYIFGFRWVITITAIIAAIVYICKKISSKRKGVNCEKILSNEWSFQFYSGVITSILFTIMLCLFTLTHCPRYNAVNNVALIMVFAVSIYILFDKQSIKGIVSFILAVLMLIQNYITIDPVIKKMCYGMNTGNHIEYSLGNFKNEKNGFFTDNLGDYFVYNEEYAVYNELVSQTLKHINPQCDISIRIYGVYFYEMHFAGNQYTIFWDTKRQKQTYRENENTIRIYDGTIDPTQPVAEYPGFDLLLIVPARMNSTEAINRYLNAGYSIIDSFTASSTYGNMTMYQFRYTK